MMTNPSTEYPQTISLLSEEDYVEDGMTEAGRDLKRCADFFVALFCLIVFAPLFLICYIAVRCEDDGPAIYKQERIGRYGLPFYIYKFQIGRAHV